MLYSIENECSDFDLHKLSDISNKLHEENFINIYL